MSDQYAAIAGSPITTITDDITDSSTSIPVTELAVFPAAPNIATLYDIAANKFETVKYTAKSDTSGAGSLTVTGGRGYEGDAQAWSNGDSIGRLITAMDHNSLKDEKIDLAGGTMTGDLLTKTGTDYTTFRARNIRLDTGDPASGDGEDGDVWLKYED